MAVCLKCDHCGKLVSEQDEELESWWRLERYGSEFIDEPGRAKAPRDSHIEMHSIVIDNRGASSPEPVEITDEDAAAFEEALMEGYIEDSKGGIDIGAILHFCTAACLSGWSEQAAAFED